MVAGSGLSDGAASPPLRVAILDAGEAHTLAAAWDDLVGRTPQPNPHYARQVVEAHWRHGLAPAGLRLLTVLQGSRLVALVPFSTSPEPLAFGGTIARPLLSPYVTNTAPLFAADAPQGTAVALASGLAEASQGRPWRWPLLASDGPSSRRLLDGLARAGWRIGRIGTHQRPVFDRRANHLEALAAAPSPFRLKDLRRRRRRLAERGRIVFDVATEGAALVAALDEFLALERQGWKGARRTALASRPASLGFARALFADEAGPVRPRIDVLRIDGRPLAASLALVAGGSATLFKIAHDEGSRAFAPGVLLEAEIVRALHDTRFAERLDSATLPGSVLEDLFPDRMELIEIVAAPPALALSPRFTGVAARVRCQNRAMRALRPLVARLRPA